MGGTCPRCGADVFASYENTPGRPGKYCKPCKEITNQQTYGKYLAEGVTQRKCHDCGETLPITDFRVSSQGTLAKACKRCSSRRAYKHTKQHRLHITAYERKRLTDPDRFFRRKATVFNSTYKASIKAAELKQLWERQGGRCALSGVDLVVGKARTMSRRPDIDLMGAPDLDHILPASRGGRATVDNLRWVSRLVNAMRGALDTEDFVRVCEEVVRYQQRKKLVA
jgi:DNA-directed RNA polymerase subunit RPC12/RpoP